MGRASNRKQTAREERSAQPQWDQPPPLEEALAYAFTKQCEFGRERALDALLILYMWDHTGALTFNLFTEMSGAEAAVMCRLNVAETDAATAVVAVESRSLVTELGDATAAERDAWARQMSGQAQPLAGIPAARKPRQLLLYGQTREGAELVRAYRVNLSETPSGYPRLYTLRAGLTDEMNVAMAGGGGLVWRFRPLFMAPLVARQMGIPLEQARAIARESAVAQRQRMGIENHELTGGRRVPHLP